MGRLASAGLASRGRAQAAALRGEPVALQQVLRQQGQEPPLRRYWRKHVIGAIHDLDSEVRPSAESADGRVGRSLELAEPKTAGSKDEQQFNTSMHQDVEVDGQRGTHSPDVGGAKQGRRLLAVPHPRAGQELAGRFP